MKRKAYILVLPLIMIFICGITLAEPLMQKAEIKQITPQKIQKGKALKVLDENELKNKKIDIRTLPDNQRIRIEGKVVTIRELKARAAQQEADSLEAKGEMSAYGTRTLRYGTRKLTGKSGR